MNTGIPIIQRRNHNEEVFFVVICILLTSCDSKAQESVQIQDNSGTNTKIEQTCLTEVIVEEDVTNENMIVSENEEEETMQTPLPRTDFESIIEDNTSETIYFVVCEDFNGDSNEDALTLLSEKVKNDDIIYCDNLVYVSSSGEFSVVQNELDGEYAIESSIEIFRVGDKKFLNF